MPAKEQWKRDLTRKATQRNAARNVLDKAVRAGRIRPEDVDGLKAMFEALAKDSLDTALPRLQEAIDGTPSPAVLAAAARPVSAAVAPEPEPDAYPIEWVVSAQTDNALFHAPREAR